MPHKVVTKRAIESQDHERHDHDREDRVARENREVKRSDKTGALKTRRAVVIVIREIRSQKQERNYERAYLARAVSGHITSPDKTVSRNQQQRAGAVKTSVKVWQVRNVIRHRCRWRLTLW